MARKKSAKNVLAESISKKIKEAKDEMDSLEEENKKQKSNPVDKEEFENKVKKDVKRATGKPQEPKPVEKKESEPVEEKMSKEAVDYMLNNTEFDDDEANWVPQTVDDEEIDSKKYLTPEELARLNYFAERHRVYGKEAEILNLKRQIIIEKQKTIETKAELEKRNLTIIDFQMREYRMLHENFKVENKMFLTELSEKNEIDEGKKWGYDPDSGEIIIDVE